MGGGHGEPFRVPHYSIYKHWHMVPEMVKHDARLKQMGLKDPWMRNYVWYFDRRFLTKWGIFKMAVMSGFWVGLGYGTTAIICTEVFLKYFHEDYHLFSDKHGHGGHGGGHGGHGESHEKGHGAAPAPAPAKSKPH